MNETKVSLPAGEAEPTPALEVQKPFTLQFLIERWADGLKALGAGNGTGLIASGAAIQFFAAKPEAIFLIKIASAAFMGGVLLFAVAFVTLMSLMFKFDEFLADHAAKLHPKGMTSAVWMVIGMKSGNVYTRFVCLALMSLLAFLVGCATVGLLIFQV